MELIVFRKDVNTNNNWTFKLRNAGESTPTFVIVGLQAENKVDSQTQNKATIDRLPISNAFCEIGSENILLMESSLIIIETITLKVKMRLKTFVDSILKLTFSTHF